MKYKLSKYIIKKEYPKKDYIFIYHSLFGNFTRIEKNLFNSLLLKNSFFENEILQNFSNEEFSYLKENFFIVDENNDEQDIIKKKIEERKNQILNGEEFDKLQLIMTNFCNFKCNYCFCNHFTKEKEMKNMSFEIAEESIISALHILKENKKNKLTIAFFGGEPSLNFEVIKSILKKFGNSYLGISIFYEYTSNGSIMTKEIAELFLKYSVTVCFSIDYLETKTLEYRGKGTSIIKWESIEKNIALLSNIGVCLEIASVLSEETINKNFYYLVDVLKKYKIDRIYLILSFGANFYKQYSPEFISKKVLEYYKYCFKKEISLEGYWYETFNLIIDPDLFKERQTYKTCPSIGKMLSIEPDGNIFSCKTTNKKLGNIKEIKKIFNNDEYKYYAMRAYINSSECIGCEIQGFCSGNCAGANENNLGNIYKVDSLFCETMKHIINEMLDFYINTL